MNKNKMLIGFKALLLVLLLMLTTLLSANASCLKQPDKTLILNAATVFETACAGKTEFDIECSTRSYRQEPEKYKRGIKEGNKWLYIDIGSGGGITVLHNCRQFTISYGIPYEFPSFEGFPGSTEEMEINCTGSIRENGRFVANCTGGTLNVFCYSNGLCATATVKYTQIGRFRK